MLIAAVGHFYAFPYKEYAGANIGGSRGFSASLGHAVKLNDFYHDTVHQVSLTSYVLWLLSIFCRIVRNTFIVPWVENFGLVFLFQLIIWYYSTLWQFAPTYHDYVLYNHSEGEEGTRKYRSRTFVPIGPEMDNVRKNKHIIGNKVDDIQLVSLSSTSSTPSNSVSLPDASNSDALKSSLLLDVSNAGSIPYDLTLIDLDVSGYPEKVPAADNADARRWS